MTSSSDFFLPDSSADGWSSVTLLARRRHALLYTAARYGRTYVLKALPEEVRHLTDYRLQQEREFRVGLMLHHPGVAETYSLEEVPDLGRCIVIEHIDGVTLDEWLRSKPARPARKRLWRQLEDTLGYLSARQMEHHDLKADNLMVTRDGQYLKLIDFGLSGIEEGRSDRQDKEVLFRLFFPSPLSRFAVRHERLLRALPLALGAVLLVLSFALFAATRHEKQAEEQRQTEAIAEVHRLLDREVINWETAVVDAPTFYEATKCLSEAMVASVVVRDSLLALYPEPDPLHYAIFDIWTQGAVAAQNRLMQSASSKPVL